MRPLQWRVARPRVVREGLLKAWGSRLVPCGRRPVQAPSLKSQASSSPGLRHQHAGRRPPIENSPDDLVPAAEVLARDNGAKSIGEVIAPPMVFWGRMHPGGRQRLQARLVADDGGRSQKADRQRAAGVLQRFAKVIKGEPAR